MIDREILWKRVKVVEIKDVNAYAHKKEEARQEISHSRSTATSAAYPSSRKYAPKDHPKGDIKVDHTDEEAINGADKDADGGAQP